MATEFYSRAHKLALLSGILTILFVIFALTAGCRWNTDFRDRQQPQTYPKEPQKTPNEFYKEQQAKDNKMPDMPPSEIPDVPDVPQGVD